MGKTGETRDPLVRGYEILLEFLAAPGAAGQMDEILAAARERLQELGELTREEIDDLGDYVRRDLADAGRFLADDGSELRDWLRFDLEQIERRALEFFMAAADGTRVAWAAWAEAAHAPRWYSGEVAGIGTLRCTTCGTALRLTEPGRIPACAQCGAQEFTR